MANAAAAYGPLRRQLPNRGMGLDRTALNYPENRVTRKCQVNRRGCSPARRSPSIGTRTEIHDRCGDEKVGAQASAVRVAFPVRYRPARSIHVNPMTSPG